MLACMPGVCNVSKLKNLSKCDDYLPGVRAHRHDKMCRWYLCWVCPWVVYSRLDYQSVTLEHTHRHRALCQSPPDDCRAENADPIQPKQIQQLNEYQVYRRLTTLIPLIETALHFIATVSTINIIYTCQLLSWFGLKKISLIYNLYNYIMSIKTWQLTFGKGYSTVYMSQRFTTSEVAAADWHEPLVPQRIMWPSIARDNWQFIHGAASRRTIAPIRLINHTRLSARSRSYYSFSVPLRVGGWVSLNTP